MDKDFITHEQRVALAKAIRDMIGECSGKITFYKRALSEGESDDVYLSLLKVFQSIRWEFIKMQNQINISQGQYSLIFSKIHSLSILFKSENISNNLNKLQTLSQDLKIINHKLYKEDKEILSQDTDIIEHYFKKYLNNNTSKIIDQYQEKIEQLENIITDNENKITFLEENYKKAKEKTEEHIKLETEKVFNIHNEILSKNFFNKQTELKLERKNYRTWAIIGTILLGFCYITFFFFQFFKNSGDISYANHLMLIAVCSPLIFLVIWLFYEANRITRLMELYSFKANLGYTLKNAIDHIKIIEGETSNQITLKTLQDLLLRFYDCPINSKEEKGNTTKIIQDITDLLKELKELISSIKTKKV